MKSLKTLLGIALATTTLGGAIAVGAVSATPKEDAKMAKAGSSSYKIVGQVASLGLTNFTYANGHSMTNGGSENVAFLKGVTLTQGDVFKLTDNSSWLGYSNNDGYGDEANSNFFYYAAQNNKVLHTSNYFGTGKGNKACPGEWNTYGSDSFVSGDGTVTVRMSTPYYDYGGNRWEDGDAIPWINVNINNSNYSKYKGTQIDGGWTAPNSYLTQLWEFTIDLSTYTGFQFLRGPNSDSYSDWGAWTDTWSTTSIFSSDSNFYVKKTGVYDIYITNNNKVYIENADEASTAFATAFLSATGTVCGTGTTSDDHLSSLNDIWQDTFVGSSDYSVAGGFNGWNEKDSSTEMKSSGNIHRLSNVYIGNAGGSEKYQFKVVKDHSWSTAYPNSNFNIPDGDGYYKIEFNDSTKEVTATKMEFLDHMYSRMNNASKEYFKSGAASSDALQRYTHIVTRYTTLDDFAGVKSLSPSRMVNPIANNSGLIVVLLSVVSVASLAATFIILRKKKEN